MSNERALGLLVIFFQSLSSNTVQVSLTVLGDLSATLWRNLNNANLLQSLDNLSVDRAGSVSVLVWSETSVDRATVQLVQLTDTNVLSQVDVSGSRSSSLVEPGLGLLGRQLIASGGLHKFNVTWNLQLTLTLQELSVGVDKVLSWNVSELLVKSLAIMASASKMLVVMINGTFDLGHRMWIHEGSKTSDGVVNLTSWETGDCWHKRYLLWNAGSLTGQETYLTETPGMLMIFKDCDGRNLEKFSFFLVGEKVFRTAGRPHEFVSMRASKTRTHQPASIRALTMRPSANMGSICSIIGLTSRSHKSHVIS